MKSIAWGKKLSPEEKEKLLKICSNLKIEPDYLTACIAFETGETFSPSIESKSGSKALGLLQFMPTTAIALGTTSEKLKKMSVLEQLDYVEKYFKPYANKINTLSDLYMAILWPAAIGKSPDFVLFDKADKKYPKRYIQNRGLDFNKDGKITLGETCKKIEEKLVRGKTKEFFG